jgi:hypothetical protein
MPSKHAGSAGSSGGTGEALGLVWICRKTCFLFFWSVCFGSQQVHLNLGGILSVFDFNWAFHFKFKQKPIFLKLVCSELQVQAAVDAQFRSAEAQPADLLCARFWLFLCGWHTRAIAFMKSQYSLQYVIEFWAHFQFATFRKHHEQPKILCFVGAVWTFSQMGLMLKHLFVATCSTQSVFINTLQQRTHGDASISAWSSLIVCRSVVDVMCLHWSHDHIEFESTVIFCLCVFLPLNKKMVNRSTLFQPQDEVGKIVPDIMMQDQP